MGTRGAFGVIIGEQEKIGYNQFDSYPDGKGVDVLRWLHGITQHRVIAERMGVKPRPDDPMDGVAKFRRLAEACRLVDDDTPITDDDRDRLKGFTDTAVSTGDDWYALTRATHGDLELMLRVGYIYDAGTFPLESLFCEWAYIVDFDTEVFEVYEGFQQEHHSDGRFAARGGKPLDWEPRYEGDKFWWPVRLIASWPFTDLPTEEEFLAQTQPRDEDEVPA